MLVCSVFAWMVVYLSSLVRQIASVRGGIVISALDREVRGLGSSLADAMNVCGLRSKRVLYYLRLMLMQPYQPFYYFYFILNLYNFFPIRRSSSSPQVVRPCLQAVSPIFILASLLWERRVKEMALSRLLIRAYITLNFRNTLRKRPCERSSWQPQERRDST